MVESITDWEDKGKGVEFDYFINLYTHMCAYISPFHLIIYKVEITIGSRRETVRAYEGQRAKEDKCARRKGKLLMKDSQVALYTAAIIPLRFRLVSFNRISISPQQQRSRFEGKFTLVNLAGEIPQTTSVHWLEKGYIS